MEEKNRYLFLELLLTFILLEPVIFLFGDILSPYRLYFTLGLIGGFSFSWLNRNKQSSLIRIFINIGAVGVFIWIIYLLLNSSLLYKEVILIFIKGVIILEVIFSFISYCPPFLTYIQALSLPLLMCFPIVAKSYGPIHNLLILVYFISWMAILKIKFYGFLAPVGLKKIKFQYTIFSLAVFFLISIFLSWMLLFHFTPPGVTKGGLFLYERSGEDRNTEAEVENRYYDLQNRIHELISRWISKLESNEEKSEVLFLWSNLISEAPDIVVEVKNAQEGLIDPLRRPGLGLEKGEKDALILLLEKYLDAKVSVNKNRIKNNMVNKLQGSGFNIRERISILIGLNKMQNANSYQQVRQEEEKIRQRVDNSYADANTVAGLKISLMQLRQWRVFELYRHNLGVLAKEIISSDYQSKSELADLLTEIKQAQSLSDTKGIQEQVDKFKDVSQEAIINRLEEISNLKYELLRMDAKNQEPLTHYEATERQEQYGLASIGHQAKQESLSRGQFFRIDIYASIKNLLYALANTVFFLMLFLIAAFIILHILTERKRRRLKSIFYKNPKEFILRLYENARGIIAIFGLEYSIFMPHFTYAALVEKRYYLESGLFLRLTRKFEEAKYSNHILQTKEAHSVLNDYNTLLRLLFSRYNKISLFFRYLMSLVCIKPLFISVA